MSVVFVETEGPRAWKAAERRLLAELSTLPIRIVKLSGRREPDLQLSSHARQWNAVVVIQALRDRERGLVRLWYSRVGDDQPAGYRHAASALRGADVLERIVRPVFDDIFGRVMAAQDAMPEACQQDRASGSGSCEMVNERESLGLAEPVVARNLERGLMFGAGPWFAGQDVTTALSINARARFSFAEHWSIEPEALVHLVAHRFNQPGAAGSQRLGGARVYLMYTPLPKSRVVLAVGLGAGGLLGWSDATTSERRYAFALHASALFQLRAPMSERWALSMGVSPGVGLPASDRRTKASSQPGFVLGTFVGLEWQWGRPVTRP